MSNASVGNIYHQIINEVIEASRVDFEDQGVGEEVLEELRKGWQVKLSKLQVAAFPWDPPPPPAAQAPAQALAQAHAQAQVEVQAQAQAQARAQAQAQQAVPATQPGPGVSAAASVQQMSTPSYTSATLSPQPAPNAQSQPLANGLPGPSQTAGGYNGRPESMKPEPLIKQEPGLANNGMQQPPNQANSSQYNNAGPNIAAQRAAAQLQTTYGPRAAASISAIQGYGQGGQPQNSQIPPRPGGAAQPNQGQRLPQQAQYNQQMASQLAMQQQQQQQRGVQPPPRPGQQNNGFQQSQVDGPADDYEGVLMRRDQDGKTSEVGRVEIDHMLHDQIAARAKQMEGGGLMLPLKEATKHKSMGKKPAFSGPSGFDGGFDGIDDDIKKEEVDEDAINSDLDDPDEVDIADDDDEENMGHIMLCMYDKVQRVKNKWKCTMKDGVLNVNGKDYVFHKATGEYEW
ncbi:transcription factor IIA subunit alpha [Diaporthe australafricana]|uniref:Transcription factor IIA subunit alpha n=1 Tax=Diaporthe australafricana TaxID=127596 RepID=A0ABR3Y2V4_9PEZI